MKRSRTIDPTELNQSVPIGRGSHVPAPSPRGPTPPAAGCATTGTGRRLERRREGCTALWCRRALCQPLCLRMCLSLRPGLGSSWAPCRPCRDTCLPLRHATTRRSRPSQPLRLKRTATSPRHPLKTTRGHARSCAATWSHIATAWAGRWYSRCGRRTGGQACPRLCARPTAP